MKLSKLFFAALIVFASTTTFAQDSETDMHNLTITIPEVALLDLEAPSNNTDVSLIGTASSEAGEAVEFNATNSTIWLNYSSIIGGSNKRNITAKITSGNVPAGLSLKVQAGAANTSFGNGDFGTPAAAALVLNDSDTEIISNVGSVYTGDGVNKGHNLTYSLVQSGSYEDLRHNGAGETLVITYTLSDD
jgi:hypothetical protein